LDALIMPPNGTNALSATAARSARDDLLKLSIGVGEMATIVLEDFPADSNVDETREASVRFAAKLSQVWIALIKVAGALSLNVPECVMKKVHLNGKKYPVDLCQVRNLSMFAVSFDCKAV
jgi:hypothetical protein